MAILERQYSQPNELRRLRLVARLQRDHGFTWTELVKLTGMRVDRTVPTPEARA